MAVDSTPAGRARIAFQRFGFGPKPGGTKRIAGDAKAAVLAELDAPSAALIERSDLPDYAEAAAAGQRGFEHANPIFLKERRARVAQAVRPEIGFVERLVTFWSNHFSMSVWKDHTVLATIGQLERDVIRRHVLGNFSDMLVGVMQHPAMICFLDNDDSMGPNSPIGKSWGAGYNENLAREILELHTVGVGGGYTEADVTNFARIITGWTFVRSWEADRHWFGGSDRNRGQFQFRPSWHEPGAITVMGKRYPAEGIRQGEAVLEDLARHPKTAEHIAFKLVLHFVTDTPTEAMVEPVAAAFRRTGGDLAEVARALVELPPAWSAPMTKIRTPYELSIAQLRATGAAYPAAKVEWAFTEPLRALLNLPWEYGQPDGVPDESAAWLNPDAMRIRLDTALLFSDMFGAEARYAPSDLFGLLFGAASSASSRSAVAGAPDARRGLAVLMMTPEFQRR